ncbi:amidohydrolase [Pseudogemmobacter faecipullorum]
MTADLIITNAKILTMDPANPRAEALALGAGRIIAVGTAGDVLARRGAATKVVDAKGRMLLPGFFESHLHIGLGGAELDDLQLTHVEGMEGLREAFLGFAAASPDRALLMAQGAHYGFLREGEPARLQLDQIIADRPIAMTSHDHHTVWANTRALELAGILNGLETPPGHEVVMGEDGLATGELLEFEAFGPVVALGGLQRMNLGIATGGEPEGEVSQAERDADKACFERGLQHCARHGITSMVTMDGNRYTLECLAELRDEGRLLARVKVPFHFKPHMGHADLDRAEEMSRSFNDEWLSSGFVKMFMDGVMDSGTAYMLQPYPTFGHTSVPLFPPAVFNPLASEIDRRGLQIAVHAIGDGAVRTVIDGYETARVQNGKRDARHRIEHIELIDPEDAPRLAALGITASLQPSHPPGAMDFGLEPTLTNIGAARWKDAYRHRSLADLGVHIAYASDWPVTDVSVMRSLQAVLTRKAYSADCADERLSLEQSLFAYTAGGAWAAHADHICGRLMPGLAADLVLLNADLEAVEADQIGSVDVALTICGGRVTYAAPGEAI